MDLVFRAFLEYAPRPQSFLEYRIFIWIRFSEPTWSKYFQLDRGFSAIFEYLNTIIEYKLNANWQYLNTTDNTWIQTEYKLTIIEYNWQYYGPTRQ